VATPAPFATPARNALSDDHVIPFAPGSFNDKTKAVLPDGEWDREVVEADLPTNRRRVVVMHADIIRLPK
jgi:hypothetical protein